MKHLITLLIYFSFFLKGYTQQGPTGIITGTVRDKNTQEPLIGVAIQIDGKSIGTTTGTDGSYRLVAPVGSYNLKASFVGFQPQVKFNINLTSGNTSQINFELTEEQAQLSEVTVKSTRSTAAVTTLETPNSIQRLSTEEIRSNPGGNFDISRVIQSLPGVGGTSGSVGGFRNDIIIRGGAPNENVFYLDGIEIPVINHFSTQGASGGPTGILNVSFIEDVTLSSSSFDARYDNALASVFQFKQRQGNQERLSGNVRLSGTELAGTLEGPLSSKTNFIASARRSYLQLLFSALDLPIRPNYWDFQYKVTHKLNAKTTITALGVGAIDEFSFAVPKESTPENDYILRSNPNINQWNYTVGFAIKRLINKGYINLAISRNHFNNRLDRFEDRQEGNEARRALGIKSNEIENKLRLDVNRFVDGWKFSYGAVAQYIQFDNKVFNKIRNQITAANGTVIQPAVILNYASALDFWRLGAFGQVAKSFVNDRLSVSAGIRTDMNSFMETGLNPLQTLSPRVALSYALTSKWTVNASVGRYFKLPVYTVLGYKDSQTGQFVNKSNKYISSNHYVAGVEYLPQPSRRFTLEGFYKQYNNYPVSVRDGISLANQGGDFGSIGNEAVTSNGKGRAFGLEFLFQQKLTKNLFAVLSYTYVRSEFSGNSGKLVPSAWDNRHLVSGLLGRKFGKGWEMGLRYRFAGGAPYTPFDLVASQRNFLTVGRGTLDYAQLNTQRLGNFSQFDFRIDKKWNYRRATLDVFFDVSNAFVQNSPAYPQYTFTRNADNTGFATTDGQALRPDGSNAIPLILQNNDPSVVPTIGFIVEF